MKSSTMILLTIFIALLMPLPSSAFADIGSICLYVAEDDKKRLRKLLKTNRVKIRNLYKDVKCNEKSLLQFAIERNANTVGVFMVKKIPVSQLKSQGDLEWAQGNGFADSAITKAITDRIGS